MILTRHFAGSRNDVVLMAQPLFTSAKVFHPFASSILFDVLRLLILRGHIIAIDSSPMNALIAPAITLFGRGNGVVDYFALPL